MMLRTVLAGMAAGLAVMVGASAQDDDGRRLALLIANEAYEEAVGRLERPHEDAERIAGALREVGFEVRLVRDAGRAAFLDAVFSFADDLRGAGDGAIGFVYYAGHGAAAEEAAGRRNYFLPSDAQAYESARGFTERDLRRDGVAVDTVLDELAPAIRSLNDAALFVVTDACRNTLRGMRGAGEGTRGFAPVQSPGGLFLAYATTDGAEAPDDGVYAEALATQITAGGQYASRAFSLAAREVAAERGYGVRRPVVSDALNRDVCFVTCPGEPAPAIDAREQQAAGAFALAESSDTVYGWELFLGSYGDTSFADEARFRRDEAEQRAAMPPPEPEREPGEVFRDCPDCPEMVVIPAGSFTMGSPASEEGRNSNEGPQRTVRIAQPFAAGRFEVTFDEWAACVSGGGCSSLPNPSDNGWGRGRRPVIEVDWNDAQAYVDWLSERTGEDYRLLSEAEWEYAGRAGTRGRFSNDGGERALCAIANGSDQTRGRSWSNTACSDGYGGQTAPVGSFAPNAFGLHDMHGNVHEWTRDCWNESYSGAPSDGRAWESGDCSRRVLRGGSWSDPPQDLRSAYRDWSPTDNRNGPLGFRVARTVSP